MADFIRRKIKPVLKGLDNSTLEVIVGILEISGETGELDSGDQEDMVDLLLSSGYCQDSESAMQLSEDLADIINVEIVSDRNCGDLCREDVASAFQDQGNVETMSTRLQLMVGIVVLASTVALLSRARKQF
eukprot:TRINITY_DN41813_c0_g1_i1.p1 TRINITY_DN41813_c0_g1~~TRINITY_DN41813_c0_g1_i1.p1  ORF type:complete len:131 (-),score=18.92 TRINITY_DN41813_c0_g1_i1:342-734(-)